MLEVPFALDGAANVIVSLDIDQTLEAVSLREPIEQTLPVLPDTSGKIAGDTDVERAVGTVGQDVDPATAHGVEAFVVLADTWMAGSSPAMTSIQNVAD